MQPSASEQVTNDFYQWEQLGRGWLFYEVPIELEPPFYPFFYHEVPIPQNVIDDGKRHSLLTWIGAGIKRLLTPKQKEIKQEPEPAQPYLFECDEQIRVFSVSLPKGYKVTTSETEQLLLMLSDSQFPISFEIVGTSTSIAIQITCRSSDSLLINGQIKAYFPDCIVKERTDLVEELLSHEDKFASVIHYGLRDEFMRPLRMAGNLNPDPLSGIFGTLEHLEEGQCGIIQMLFKGAINPWTESIIRSVTDSQGKSFFENAPEMLPLAKEKIASPLLAVAMRVIGVGFSTDEAHIVSQAVGKALARIYFSESNSLIPLYPDISFAENIKDIVYRETHLLGMLLNTSELATIVHLPSATVVSSKLERDTRKTKQSPKITEGHKLILGINEHQGKKKQVTIDINQRLRHTHIIGATGTGKSTLLQSMIIQDIQFGNGVAVLDPHGDLIENILPHIPEHRRKDVLIIDPADRDFPVGFNFFIAHSETEKDILSSDLVAVFKRLSTSWGDQMNSVLANAILAFLESTEGGTMIDLRRFLVEKSFRDSFLKTVNDPSIRYYWQKEYPLLKSNSIGSILTRLDTFLRPKLIRNMVAQKKSLDFEQLLDTQKIVLVKLSQGLIGNENSYLLGTVIVSKIHQAAMARQAKEDRKDFFVYIDEFQNFITPSMSHILSGARKYHVGLVLAHQDMQQLLKYDSELASSIVSNAGTRICFRLGDVDAKRFDNGFSSFDARDLENLSTGQAICRIERPDYDFSLQTVPLPQIDTGQAEQVKLEGISHSRSTYGTPRQDVEALLNELPTDPDKQEQEQPPVSQTESTPATQILQQEVQPISDEQLTATKEKYVKQIQETEHRSLQTKIKKMAEQRGFKATLEAPTPDGKGKVDVLLERNGKRIACEVSITTETNWEIHNIQKCLESGYELVVECSNSKKTLEDMRKKVAESFDTATQTKILVLEPELFFQYLDTEIAKEATTETRMKGYRVKVEYNADAANMDQKRKAIGKTVRDSAKKKDRK